MRSPRSLEWADMAAERVGLDPLADDYRELGTGRHRMTYVRAGAESIPFPDGHFDVVVSMNSLDHVHDVDRAIAEMGRVAKVGGIMLLMVEINGVRTASEPHSLPIDIVDRFRPAWTVLTERCYAGGE